MSQLVKTIYGLYAVPEGDYETIHSISLNQEKLQEIINTKIPDEIKEIVKFQIKPIKIYLLIKLLNNPETNKFFKIFGTSKNLILMLANSIKVDTFKNKIFAFNRIITNDCTQCLVAIVNDTDSSSEEYQEHLKYVKSQKLFENNISDNPIDFDVYYDESIMNV